MISQDGGAVEPQGMWHPEISLIMPAYNLGDKIESAILAAKETLDKLRRDYEIIVIDDGSFGNTYQRAKTSSDRRIKFVRNSVNQGKGFSCRRGVELAGGDFVVLSDADLEIDIHTIASYLNALRDHDVVIASKRHPLSSYDAPLMRRLLSASFNAVVKIMMGLKCSDTQTGLKAFRSDEIKKIMKFVSVKRYAFDVEVLVVAKLMNLRTIEMPVSIKLGRRFKVRSVMYMVIDLLGIFYRYRVIRWYQQNLSNGSPSYRPIVKI